MPIGKFELAVTLLNELPEFGPLLIPVVGADQAAEQQAVMAIREKLWRLVGICDQYLASRQQGDR
jgi:hypothetical protein